MSFPVHDWQFWVATAIALGAAMWLVRAVTPWGKRRKRRGSGKRATLTVKGKAVERECH